MPDIPVLWAIAALLLFWLVGAYNRLVRLRTAVVRAFAALDQALLRLQALLAECDLAPAQVQGPVQAAQQALQAAAGQFGASLAQARQQPLQRGAITALAAGLAALDGAWQALVRAREDEDGPVAVAPWRAQWQICQTHQQLARTQFNTAVAQYNAAIAQFPPSLLAWLFGFRAAGTL